MDAPLSPLRQARLRLGLTLNELALKVGISTPSLSSIETGKQTPRLDTVRKLAAETGLRPEQIDPRLTGLVPENAA